MFLYHAFQTHLEWTSTPVVLEHGIRKHLVFEVDFHSWFSVGLGGTTRVVNVPQKVPKRALTSMLRLFRKCDGVNIPVNAMVIVL